MSGFREVERKPLVEENIFDKVVQFVSPRRGIERRRARAALAMTGGYVGGKRDRRAMKSWRTSGGSADADTLSDLSTLRERSRDLSRNHPLVTGAVGTILTGTVGHGLKLDSQINRRLLGMTEDQARDFEERAESGFRLWSHADHCDLTRTQSFPELQGLAFRSVLESGDLLVLMPWHVYPGNLWGLKMQMIEADRISNPKNERDTERMIAGVEINEWGAPVRYHVQSLHPGDHKMLTRRYEWTEYDAFTKDGRRAALHLYERLRPDQHRGIPLIAPIIEKLKVLDEYTDAELRAAVVSAMFTVFTHLESGDSLNGIDPLAAGTPSAPTTDEDELKLEGGAVIDLRLNEKVDFANPTRPNAQFDPFYKAIVQQIGVALGLPQEVLLKIFLASYSASRAALAEAHRFYMTRRTWLIRNFCEPIYEAWMTEAVASGYLYAPGYFEDPIARQAYLGANWIGSPMIQIDPVKEITAAAGRVELGISTRSEECASLTGKDWDQIPEQLKWEQKQLAGVGVAAGSAEDNEDLDGVDEEEKKS